MQDGLSPDERRAVELMEKVDEARLQRISKELHGESDRAAVILGAAWLDEGLKDLLGAFLLVGAKQETEELFGNNGPLGSFSARIVMSHRLGLISKDVKTSLDVVRRIRNKFAHEVETPRLDGQWYKQVIATLPNLMPSDTFWEAYKTKFYGEERSPRVTLRASIAVLVSHLVSSVPVVKRAALQPLLSSASKGYGKMK